MKKIALTSFLVCSLLVLWSNTTDREARCEIILAPFSQEQSLADRVSQDLLTGVWRTTLEQGFQFIYFDPNGWSEILQDVDHKTEFKTYKWSVFEIGELVYLRMDGGNRNDDHLYIVRQNCDGILLNHTFTDEVLNLDFISSKDEDEVAMIEANLVGDWAEPTDPTVMSLALQENGEFIYMDRQLIQTGRWEVFIDGIYLMLYREEVCEPWIIPIKHIDFNHLDLIMSQPLPSDRPGIVSLEKQKIFN